MAEFFRSYDKTKKYIKGTLQELELQHRLAKYCGLVKPTNRKWSILFTIYHTSIVFSISYVLFHLMTFLMMNHNNILEVSEILAPLITGSSALLKFIILLVHLEDVLRILEQIKELNETCKSRHNFS